MHKFIFMTRLSVNVNKIATLRNSRGGTLPNLLKVTEDIVAFGADGITVHPRPDERHITYKDVIDISKMLKKKFPKIEFNIEGYPSKKFLSLIDIVKPDQITLVPDLPGVLTSDTGWDVKNKVSFIQRIVKKIKSDKSRICLFINPEPNIIEYVMKTGVDSVELFTGEYAKKFKSSKEKVIKKYIETANIAFQNNIGINAGHDLNLENLFYFKKNIKYLDEVSIGHAVISDSLYYGLENTIQLYKRNLL